MVASLSYISLYRYTDYKWEVFRICWSDCDVRDVNIVGHTKAIIRTLLCVRFVRLQYRSEDSNKKIMQELKIREGNGCQPKRAFHYGHSHNLSFRREGEWILTSNTHIPKIKPSVDPIVVATVYKCLAPCDRCTGFYEDFTGKYRVNCCCQCGHTSNLLSSS